MLTAGSVLDLPLCYLYCLWYPVQKRLPWEGEIFTQTGEIYGKLIVILLTYINRQRDRHGRLILQL